MSFLLDTNVVSELRKSPGRVDARVRAWVASRDVSSLHLSAITIMEIEIGIGRLARRDQIQADRLRTWLDDAVLAAFAGRILPVDLAVARRVARLHVPDPRPERDAMIAATATVHGLTVVTRNVADFESLDVALVDPWSVPADD
ncbi:type II toxin-antitoxin system VapC family toxin [Aeromicrobium fastidiosum]|uniref:type II toxin-antitoxin system VapC family toxin n=1 Tax=Aeromicrobium fastidiosum TaxID=52699 RepID=UPI0020232C3B|nr:type II toxin-antitoxin system VapC family toxin [Aeromicrobium fastidiosum]MCL8250451.1 type II toxin-antitoxin system VapC family toxin [Aeromicrobium fastidiosum]